MLTRIYKKNSFTVKHEPFHDGDAPETIAEFIEAINNDLDAPDVFRLDGPQYGGNYYAFWYVAFTVNGLPRWYRIDDTDLADYRAGYTVRFIYESDAPLFEMPAFYDFCPFEYQGMSGTLYKLEKPLAPEFLEEHAGANYVYPMHTRAQYAPELVSSALFVPNGVTFEFC